MGVQRPQDMNEKACRNPEGASVSQEAAGGECSLKRGQDDFLAAGSATGSRVMRARPLAFSLVWAYLLLPALMLRWCASRRPPACVSRGWCGLSSSSSGEASERGVRLLGRQQSGPRAW
jgi:hypothetical protein